jgi:hypothetical protein
MRFALLTLFLACGGPPAQPAPAADVTIEWTIVPPRWVEPFIRTDGDDFRAWAADPKSAIEIAVVRHILIRKDRAKAEAILQRLTKGEDFVAIASSESDDTSKIRGGAVGSDTSKFVEPFRNAANALKPGERSGIVETQFGFHILMKDPITPETTQAAYRRGHAVEIAKAIAQKTIDLRPKSPSMDVALAAAIGQILGDVATKDRDKPIAHPFEEEDACTDKARRLVARQRGEPILLCGEVEELAKLAGKRAPNTGFALLTLAAWAK